MAMVFINFQGCMGNGLKMIQFDGIADRQRKPPRMFDERSLQDT